MRYDYKDRVNYSCPPKIDLEPIPICKLTPVIRTPSKLHSVITKDDDDDGDSYSSIDEEVRELSANIEDKNSSSSVQPCDGYSKQNEAANKLSDSEWHLDRKDAILAIEQISKGNLLRESVNHRTNNIVQIGCDINYHTTAKIKPLTENTIDETKELSKIKKIIRKNRLKKDSWKFTLRFKKKSSHESEFVTHNKKQNEDRIQVK